MCRQLLESTYSPFFLSRGRIQDEGKSIRKFVRLSSGNLETSSRTVESAGKVAISSDSMDSKLKNSSASKMERKSFVLKTKDHPMLKQYVQLLTCHYTSLLSLAHACTHM